VRVILRYLILGVASAAVFPAAVVVIAAPASADCNNAGYATICAQGTVTGGSNTPPQAGPVYPGYCADPWYCSDDWGLDIIVDPGPPGIGFPGRPGGIGPRR
jgi:hypothetical protein